MSSPSQLAQFAFAGGIDQGQRPEVLDPTTGFTYLQNVRQERRGGVSKRPGFASLANTMLDGSSRSSGSRLFVNGKTICVIGDNGVSSYSETLGAWTSQGWVPEATYRHLEVPSVGVDHSVEDLVHCNGYVVVAQFFNEDTDFFAIATVLDATTGAVVLAPEAIDNALASSGTRSYLATYGAYVIAFVFDLSATEIRTHYLDMSSRASINAGWQSIGVVASDCASLNGDAASLGTRVAIVYPNTSGGASRLTVTTLDISGVIDTVAINTSSITPTGQSLSEGGTTLWVAWAEETVAGPINTTDFRVTGLDPLALSGAALASTATVIQTVRSGFGGGVTWLADTGGGGGALYAINENVFACDGLNVRTFTTSAGATTPAGTTRKLGNSVPVGRPFVRSDRVYIPLASSNLEELVICDCTTPELTSLIEWRPVAVPIQRGLFNLLTSNPRVRVSATVEDRWLFAYNVLKSGSVVSGTNGTNLVELDFADRELWTPVVLGRTTFIAGGVTSAFDGRRVCEVSFLCCPPAPSIDVSTAGGQTFTLGGRSYVATYEEVDSDGNWHVSGVSEPTNTGNIAAKSVVIDVAPLTITARGESNLMPVGSGLRIGLWVTRDGGTEPYYRLTTLPNRMEQESVQYTDTSIESAFTSNALLYGTGNLPGSGASQDHRAPPGLKYHVSYNGMLIGVSGKDIFYSAQPIDGEGTWFSPVFTQAIDDDATGIATQDGTVYIFTRGGIFAIAGEPPSDSGSTGGLGLPRKLAVDVGCINSNSIAVTGLGIFFQSDRGIEILTRAQSVEPIGTAIQDTLDSFPLITSAVIDAKRSLVRISLESSGGESTSGVTLIYDLSNRVWQSVDVYPSDEAPASASMIYFEGSSSRNAWRYAWLGEDGTVHYERNDNEADAHLDEDEWITMRAETAWVKLSGIQGQQHMNRVLLLAKQGDVSDLSMALACDYNEEWKAPQFWTDEVLDTLSSSLGRVQIQHFADDDGQGQAIRLAIEDATPTSGNYENGQGHTWVAVTFDGTPRDGAALVSEEAA